MFNLIGFLGIQKDSRGYDEKRWSKFRPSIGLCMQDDLSINNYYVLYDVRFINQMDFLKKDIEQVSPETNVIPVEMNFTDPFDPMEALEKQLDFVSSLPEGKDYLINLTTGTHINQLAWFKLVEENFINAKLVQAFGISRKDKGSKHIVAKDKARGYYNIIDFKLEKYDRYFALLDNQKVSSEDFLKSGIDTRNDQYNGMISMIEKIAVKNNHPILIDGKTGVGKTNIIKNIYDLKKSKGIVSGDFISINCATLVKDSAMSVLFGHKKGSFTGAIKDRDGLIKLSDKGVLFLDEIGTLSMDVQKMLLHALEEKSFYPMGSDSLEGSDFTLFCGSNVDLYDEVEKGNFREDLLARINLWNFTMLGLKDRREDIEPNLDYEIKRSEVDLKTKVRFNKEARKLYLDFALSDEAIWKRNFRDLNSSVVRMVTLSDNNIITVSVVDDEIKRLLKSWGINKKKSVMLVNKAYDFIGEDVLKMSKIDLLVLNETIDVCLSAKNASEASRVLYDNINGDKLSLNPSGRLNKYLLKFNLSFNIINHVN